MSAIAFIRHDVIAGDGAHAQSSVFAADVDGDGNVDILSASNRDGQIAWNQNINGAGTFGTAQVIVQNAAEIRSVIAADLDADGDVDVLAAHESGPSGITWYENTDGAGEFGTQQVIANQPARSVSAADVDGDGDLDVLVAAGDEFAWIKNNGSLVFGPRQVIAAVATPGDNVEADSVHAADIDGDGDLDVLATYSSNSLTSGAKIVWYENTDGAGTFGARQLIAAGVSDVTSGYAADLDGDGDRDVLWALFRDSKIVWYENSDGAGTFGPVQVVSRNTDQVRSIFAADVNGDDDIDLVAAFDDGRTAWYENRLLGDANDDGVFDSSDLVQVFQVGQYEDGIAGNSTFDEGDWNQDGDFDSSDFIFALQAGHYGKANPDPGPACDATAHPDGVFASVLMRGRARHGKTPLNSVAAIREAHALGNRQVEIDVYISADGFLIPLRHEELSVDSTCAGSVALADRASLESCGYLSNPSVPLLPLDAALTDLAFDAVYVDLKSTRTSYLSPSRVVDVFHSLLAVAAQPQSIVAMSYDTAVAEALVAAGIRTAYKGYPPPERSTAFIEQAGAIGAEMVSIEAKSLHTEAVQRAEELGIWLLPWEYTEDVNRAMIETLLQWRAGGLISAIADETTAWAEDICPGITP